MTTNLYLNNFGASREQELLNDCFKEAIQFGGIDVMFMPRSIIAEDVLYGEDVLSAFKTAFNIEMMVDQDTIDGFGGEDIIEKQGLEIPDTINLLVHKNRFEEVTGLDRPKTGDLIYFPFNKGLFEIKFAENEVPFYQLGNLYMFKLFCELFVYSGEDLDTGVSVVDAIEDKFENKVISESDPISGEISDSFADNVEIEVEADKIIDFSTENPFGEF